MLYEQDITQLNLLETYEEPLLERLKKRRKLLFDDLINKLHNIDVQKEQLLNSYNNEVNDLDFEIRKLTKKNLLSEVEKWNTKQNKNMTQ